MKRHSLLPAILLTVCFSLALAGCSKISVGDGKKQPGGQNQTGPGPGAGAGDAGGETATQALPANPIEGYWQLAFSFNGQVQKASVLMHQSGTSMSGEGTDDGTDHQFQISGTINGDQVSFVKQYQVANANVPPVQYVGEIKMVNDKDYKGPWMSGKYQTTVKGQPVSEDWEAQKTGEVAGSDPGNNPPPDANNPPPDTGPAIDPNKAPDLSGKWLVGYKYNFKTIKSEMFLEQLGGQITGHGLDKNTGEKFEVEKGWYAFPKVTLVRAYKKGKGAASDRKMTFKGTVQVLREKDYQGAYLHGESQGGGEWEAEQVR